MFDVPGVKFVFVANMQQLKAVIRKRYGQDVDADVYLEKFVKFSFTLPKTFGYLFSEDCAFALLENFGKEHSIVIFMIGGHIFIK